MKKFKRWLKRWWHIEWGHRWCTPRHITIDADWIADIRQCTVCGDCQKWVGGWCKMWRYDFNKVLTRSRMLYKKGWRYLDGELINIDRSVRGRAIWNEDRTSARWTKCKGWKP